VPLDAVPDALLRTWLCVVPQSPTLFTGTLRDNLDPHSRLTDAQLLTATAAVGASANGGPITSSALRMHVSANGSALSAGERQLLCLARALAMSARAIVLDEATSSLSAAAVAATQAALVASAAHATILQVAHQTSAVMQCDRVLVFSAGRMIEDGAPNVLLTRPDGAFANLVRHDARRRDGAGASQSTDL